MTRQCGERPILPPDLTLRGVFDRLLHAVTSVDSRMLRSLEQYAPLFDRSVVL